MESRAWEVQAWDDGEDAWDVIDESGYYVVVSVTEKEARLIAAAPQMLDALRATWALWTREHADWCQEYDREGTEPCGECAGCLAYAAAKAAIAAAEVSDEN